MHSFLFVTILVLALAQLAHSITFTPVTGNSTSTPSTSSSSSFTLNWTRETNEPSNWALAPVFTFGAGNTVFEFQFVSHSNRSSGQIEIPVQFSANITLVTFSYQFKPKKGQLQFNGDLFGQFPTFEVIQTSDSPLQVNPGHLPSIVQSELMPAQSTTNKTPMIVGIAVGSAVFLLLIIVLSVMLFCRRRRARNRAAFLLKEHEQYRSMPPSFASFSDERRASHVSNAWSASSTRELLMHPNISPALSFRAAAAVGPREDVTNKPATVMPLPEFPGNSLSPQRSLHALSLPSNSNLASERQRDVERAIQRLQNKMVRLQANQDRNTVEGIEDEVGVVHIKLEMKRILDSEWALGLTDEMPAGL